MVSSKYNAPPDKSSWQYCEIQERQKWLNELFIEYPSLAEILGHFDEKLTDCERTGKATGMLIIGGSGAGKTTLMNRLKSMGEQRFSRHERDRKICPVISIEIPDPCTPIEFSFAILEALGDADPRGRKNKQATIKAAEMFLIQCEVRLILIDNVQDIPARRAARGVEQVSTRLRELIDKSNAVWVFLGTKEATKVINSDPQVVKRVVYRADLEYFSIGTLAGARLFTRVLEKIDAQLPLAKPSCLVEPKNRSRIFLGSDGIFDRLIKLVDRGWYESFKDNREEMTLQDLERAFRHVHGPCEPTRNPFSNEFSPRQLHLEGEPFEILKGAPLAHKATA